MYTVLSMLFLFLIWHEVGHGPELLSAPETQTPPSAKITSETAEA
jgi:hypothetical protein